MTDTARESTPDRWAKVERVLDEALDRPPGEWEAFLDRSCRGDAALRREVESLLRRHRELEGFLTAPAIETVAGPEDSFPEGPAPEARRIGPYRIVREIARGGMGQVLLAERADGEFEQRVAVKLLQPGLDTEDVVRRFRAERQILAALEHPSISRLIDGGVAEDGRPYLVMEFVQGERIDRYCDRRRSSVRERLRLFLQVAEAVEYAHRNLIVHRDLKPSNIQVSADGQVKLLDFGIAKLLEAEAGGGSPRTRTGRRWMTPEYAAPEQIRGEPVNTATDIYQLGVLLFELLSGHRPFETETESLHRMERAVLEKEPERPSAAVERSAERTGGRPGTGESPERVARARSTGPERLCRALRGDLDAIALKGLRKEPGARYGSVRALMTDVERHLAGRPVAARRGTAIYRAAKFTRRHRWGVAAATAFLLLLAGSTVATTIQARQIAQERDRAQQATTFLAGLFQELEPVETPGSTVPAKEILDRAVGRIRGELAGQPLLQAELLDVVGRVYQHRGLFAEAEALLEEAMTIRLRRLGPDHLAVADSRLNLGVLRYTADDHDTDALFQAAIATYRKRLGADHPRVADAMTNRAIALRARGDFAAAESLFREVLESPARGPAGNDARATALTYLGKLLAWKGEYREAEELLAEALALRRESLGAEHPVVANVLEATGELDLARGNAAGADEIFRRVLAMRRKFFAEDHPDIGAAHLNLALVRKAYGDLAEAERLLRNTIAVYRRAFGEGSKDVAVLLRPLGATLRMRDDRQDADEVFREALDIWNRHSYGATHPYRSDLLVDLAGLRLSQGRAAEAEPLLRDALDIRRRVLSDDSWRVAEAQGWLGECLTALERYEEAEPLLVRSHEILERKWGLDHRRTEEARARLVGLYEAWNAPARTPPRQALTGRG